MPIQVVSTFLRVPPPAVILLSAGDDVFPLCDPTITLTAIFDKIENVPGHAIIWEQLRGTPVILSPTNAISTTYTQILNDESDKEFKVTIDVGTEDEQSDTVIVYATPTGVATTSFSRSMVSRFIATSYVEASTFNVTTTAIVPPPIPDNNDDVTVVNAFEVTWGLVKDLLIQPWTTNMTLIEDDIPVATYDPIAGDVLTYSGGPSTYRVDTDFLVAQQPSFGRGETIDYTNVPIPAVRVINNHTLSAFSQSEVRLTKFLNLIVRNEDSEPTINQSAFSRSDAITSRFINTYEIVDTTSNRSAFPPAEITVVRTDPGGIGGG